MKNTSVWAGKLALGISVALLGFIVAMTIVGLLAWHQDYTLSVQSFINIQPRNDIAYTPKLNK